MKADPAPWARLGAVLGRRAPGVNVMDYLEARYPTLRALVTDGQEGADLEAELVAALADDGT